MRIVEAMTRQYRRAFGRAYAIGIYTGPSPLALAPAPGADNPVLTRDSVSDHLNEGVADPFMVNVHGTWHMFFEVLSWRPGARKGEIGLATSDHGRRWEYRGTVLSEPFHLSYPHVFEWGSEHYMVPESYVAGAVRLYRADPFPTRWVHVANLLEDPFLVDSSLFRHDGRWWMFCGADPQGAGLRLFHAADLTGRWTEHPRSPVVTGNRRTARPAGKVIDVGERRIRFAQDCSATYGTRVTALEITALSTTRYEDVELEGPVLQGTGSGWNALGMHHLDAHQLADGSWIACVDGWEDRVRRPAELARWAADTLRHGSAKRRGL